MSFGYGRKSGVEEGMQVPMTEGDGPAVADVTALSIGEIATEVASRDYRVPFEISSGSTARLESVFLTLSTKAGHGEVGVGETTPMTAYSGETTAGLRDVIDNVLAPAVAGHPLFDLAGLHKVMDQAVRGRSLAKAAIDMALLDAQGKVLGVPVRALIGGAVRDAVQLAWVIGLGDLPAIVEEAVAKAEEGYRHIKVKGGLDPSRDALLVEELARSLPEGVEIAIDLNEGYDAATAFATLRRMERAGLHLAEQPVPAWDVEGLARLTAGLDVQVAADESLQSIHDAMRLARHRACDVFNIKLLKVGGIYRARQVAGVAEAAGIALKIGSMPELEVATLAAAQFAGATPGAIVPADLIGPLLVEGDGTAWAPAEKEVGWLSIPTGPGLGLSGGGLPWHR
jgi:L-Ala-D/L-Glu epimerase / N-acetyl-D-glutamate racemase